MLKLMKEPKFEEKIDKEFVLLYVKILFQQGKCKDAIDFIDKRQELFLAQKADTKKAKKSDDKEGGEEGENQKLER